MVWVLASLLGLLWAAPLAAEEGPAVAGRLAASLGVRVSSGSDSDSLDQARDSAAAAGEAIDPAEERRLRREARRARRRAMRAQEGAAVPAAPEEEDPDGPGVGSKSSGAMQKAQKMGDELKKSLNDGSSGDLGGGGGDGSGSGGSSGSGAGDLKPDNRSAGGAKSPLVTPQSNYLGGQPSGPGGPTSTPQGVDPTHPKTEAELLIAVNSGFKSSLAATGLKVGSGPGGGASFQRQDGSPATASDLQTLREHIESEPAALMRRPDFFTAVPREHFQSLKQDYRARPELKGTAFKDVELTPKDRDFVWAVSCDKLSGNCNKQSSEPSYKKKAEVPPEDLDSIWAEVNEGENSFLKAVMSGGGSAEPSQHKSMFSSGLDGLYDRLDSLVGGVESFFGGGGATGGAAGSDSGAAGSQAGGVGGSAGAGVGGKTAAGRPKVRRLPVVMKNLAASAGSRPILAGLGGVAAALGLFLMLRRRDDD